MHKQGEAEVDITLTEPQSEFVESTEEYIAAVAGFGSGKTDGALVKLLLSMSKYPTIDFAYLAPTYSLIRDIFYPKISGVLSDLGTAFKINKGEHIVYIEGHGKIYCRTMMDPDSIVGWEVGDAVMDELDILPTDKAERVINKVSARCRQKFPDGKINQKYVTTTPEGFKATYNKFKKNPLENSRLIQMSTYSNAHNLPGGYISGLESQYKDTPLLEAYLGGEFVNLTAGSVYHRFDRDRQHSNEEARPGEPLHIGMDFNVYHMAGIVHVIRSGGKPIAVDELIDLRDTPNMVEGIKERYPDRAITIYPDASGNHKSSKGSSLSDIKILQDAGFTIRAHRSNPLIKDRVQAMNSAFGGEYRINTLKCPEYTNCVEQQAYDKAGVPEKTNNIDHAPDAGGYFVHYKFPINTRQAFTQSMPY